MLLHLWETNKLIFIFIDLRHKYGELITLDINEGKLVVLNTAEAIYEGFVKNSAFLSDRPMSMHNPATGGKAIVSSSAHPKQESVNVHGWLLDGMLSLLMDDMGAKDLIKQRLRQIKT